MKVRVVLMTENDKHVEGDSEHLNNQAKAAWDIAAAMLTKLSNGEICTCESAEVIEK